jgi:hypothetical protein
MKIVFLPLIVILFVLSSCGREAEDGIDNEKDKKFIDENSENKDLPTRMLSDADYPSVGFMARHGGGCSGTILKHGVFVTAKHCIVGYGNVDRTDVNAGGPISGYTIYFPAADEINADTLEIEIQKIILDGRANDIAYLIYDGKLTERVIAIDAEEILETTPQPNTRRKR